MPAGRRGGLPFSYVIRNLFARRLTTALTAGGMALVVVGGVATAVGGLLLGLAAADQASLDVRLGQVDGTGAIVGVDHATAQAEQSSINTRLVAGWSALGGGVVLATVGAILLARGPSPAATASTGAAAAPQLRVWPGARGVGLSFAF